MIFIGWIALIAITLWISLSVFLWALQTGQFSDQNRARYLPFSDETFTTMTKHPSKLTVEVYALIVIVVIGFLAFLAPLILTFHH